MMPDFPGAATPGHNALDHLVLDDEFRDLVPPFPEEQRERLIAALCQTEAEETLFVWRSGEWRTLLTGYDVLPIIRRHLLPYRIVEKEFASRDHARRFVLRNRLARRNLSRLEVIYLQGVLYQDEKQPAGGDRRSPRWSATGRTAEALAETLYLHPTTIRRGAAFVKAIRTITDLCGAQAMPALFNPRAHLGRKTVLDLAATEPASLRSLIGQLRINGRLPRGWRKVTT